MEQKLTGSLKNDLFYPQASVRNIDYRFSVVNTVRFGSLLEGKSHAKKK